MVAGSGVVVPQIGKTSNDQYSDVATIASSSIPNFPGEGHLLFSGNLAQGRLVGILGFPSSSDPSLGLAILATGYVTGASAGAGARILAGLPAEAPQWKSQRFFLVD